MTYLNNVSIDKINYDFIELIYDFSEDLVYYLENPDQKHTIINTRYNEYLVDGLFKIVIYRKPYNSFKGDNLIYVKLENIVLYQNLQMGMDIIDSFFKKQNLRFKGLKSLDLSIDIDGDFLFNQIDLNALENYVYSSKKGVKEITFVAEPKTGKTLYFNSRVVGKERRATAIVYQKDREIRKSKKTYQNPDNKVLTRLELKFRKLGGLTKENELLKAVSELIDKDIMTFVNKKEILIQYIYREWRHQYDLEDLRGDKILSYDIIFKNDLTINQESLLKDFKQCYKNNIGIINKKEADKKREQRNKKNFIKQKNLYIIELETLKDSFINLFQKRIDIEKYIDFLDKEGFLQDIIKTTELDFFSLEPINFLEKSINGVKVKETIHNYILEKVFKQNKLINKETHFIQSDIEFTKNYGDLFSDLN